MSYQPFPSKAEDAASADGDVGIEILTVRKDTAAATAGTDGDYQPPITDNTGRLWVNGSGVTQPVSGTVTTTPPSNASTNVAQINAVTPLMGNGVTGTGSQRVTVASDNTAFSVNSTLQPQTDTVMVGGVNIKEINAVTPLMGNGVTGTGSQRVTIASDNTAFAVNASGTKTNNNAAPGATNIGALTGIANAAVQTWTEGDQVLQSMDLSGNQRVTLGTKLDNVNDSITTYPLGHSFLNIAAGQATTTVKSGAGVLIAIVFNGPATATNTTTVYDNTAASGTVIAIPLATAIVGPTTVRYELAFSTGLTVITAAANGANMTFVYR